MVISKFDFNEHFGSYSLHLLSYIWTRLFIVNIVTLSHIRRNKMKYKRDLRYRISYYFDDRKPIHTKFCDNLLKLPCNQISRFYFICRYAFYNNYTRISGLSCRLDYNIFYWKIIINCHFHNDLMIFRCVATTTFVVKGNILKLFPNLNFMQ